MMMRTSLGAPDYENCSLELDYPDLPAPECLVDTNTDEIIVAILIILLVLVTFYRLIHVWAHTLNFTEVRARSLYDMI